MGPFIAYLLVSGVSGISGVSFWRGREGMYVGVVRGGGRAHTLVAQGGAAPRNTTNTTNTTNPPKSASGLGFSSGVSFGERPLSGVTAKFWGQNDKRWGESLARREGSRGARPACSRARKREGAIHGDQGAKRLDFGQKRRNERAKCNAAYADYRRSAIDACLHVGAI